MCSVVDSAVRQRWRLVERRLLSGQSDTSETAERHSRADWACNCASMYTFKVGLYLRHRRFNILHGGESERLYVLGWEVE